MHEKCITDNNRPIAPRRSISIGIVVPRARQLCAWNGRVRRCVRHVSCSTTQRGYVSVPAQLGNHATRQRITGRTNRRIRIRLGLAHPQRKEHVSALVGQGQPLNTGSTTSHWNHSWQGTLKRTATKQTVRAAVPSRSPRAVTNGIAIWGVHGHCESRSTLACMDRRSCIRVHVPIRSEDEGIV